MTSRAELWREFMMWRLRKRSPEENERIRKAIARAAQGTTRGEFRPGDELESEKRSQERLRREFDDWLATQGNGGEGGTK